VQLTSWSEGLSLVFILMFFALSSVWLVYFVCQRVVFVEDDALLEFKEYKQRYGSLYEGVRTTSSSTRAFSLIFILRRMAFVLIFVGLQKYIGLQIQAMIALNFA